MSIRPEDPTVRGEGGDICPPLRLVDCEDKRAFDIAFNQDETPGKQTPATMKDRSESQVRGLPVFTCLR